MIEQRKMVIVGNEMLKIPVSNTFDSGISIKIQFTAKDKCSIILCMNEESIDVTKDCKLIQVLDHESYRRLRREYAFTIGKDVYWGMMRRYTQQKEKETQLIRTAADMLNIKYEYNVVRETGQK